MSIADNKTDVFYPESDGEPMGETETHIRWLIKLRDILLTRYKDQDDVYVGADMLVYYCEGVPRRFFVPDIFVVKNCDTHVRRVFKIWEEPSPPHMIIEITSKSTRRQDEVLKPRIYADIGVEEYFTFDPTADYMNPALQGFRRAKNAYEKIEPDENGNLHCETLDITLSLDELSLVLRDGTTGEELLTGMDLAEKRRAEEVEAMERKRAEEVEAIEQQRSEEVAKLEAEIKRLRKQLGE